MSNSRDNISMKGGYLIELADAGSGTIIRRLRVKNQLTEINRTVRAQMLLGTFAGGEDALQIKYIAVGSGTAPASAADTRLGNETFRKQVTQISQAGEGIVRTVVSLGLNEANGDIREIGVFGGPAANTTANSGTLLSRVNVSITKNSNIVINIIRTDSCTI